MNCTIERMTKNLSCITSQISEAWELHSEDVESRYFQIFVPEGSSCLGLLGQRWGRFIRSFKIDYGLSKSSWEEPLNCSNIRGVERLSRLSNNHLHSRSLKIIDNWIRYKLYHWLFHWYSSASLEIVHKTKTSIPSKMEERLGYTLYAVSEEGWGFQGFHELKSFLVRPCWLVKTWMLCFVFQVAFQQL